MRLKLLKKEMVGLHTKWKIGIKKKKKIGYCVDSIKEKNNLDNIADFFGNAKKNRSLKIQVSK